MSSLLRPHVLLATADGVAFCELAQALESNGYPFTAVRSGDEALAKLDAADGPKVAILDRRLAVVGGDAIVARIRARFSQPSDYVFCILLDPDGDGAPDTSADSVLPAPFDPFRMLVALQSVLRINMRRKSDVQRKTTMTPPEPVVDTETGIWDRDTVKHHLRSALDRLREGRGCVGVVRVKIDDFARVDRHYGAVAQRLALRACTRLIRDRVRSGEGLGRVGSAEFLIVTYGQDPNSATYVAERVRNAIRQTPFKLGDQTIRLTTSIGVAIAWSDQDADDFYRTAGKALHEATFAGGDQVVEWVAKRVDAAS